MGSRKRVVIAHLENISRSALKEYQSQVSELIQGKGGIYALYRNDNLYYVGLAVNLARRIKQHTRDKHARKWNRFSAYVTVHDEHMKDLESLLLRIVNPRGNLQTGKIGHSANLRPKLDKLIQAEHKDRLARTMGGKNQKSQIKKKAITQQGGKVLAGVFDRAVPLRGHRGGWEYRGSLRRNGDIYYDGKAYPSPSAAGKAAIKKNINGWAFWKYRDKNGNWIPIARLR